MFDFHIFEEISDHGNWPKINNQHFFHSYKSHDDENFLFSKDKIRF